MQNTIELAWEDRNLNYETLSAVDKKSIRSGTVRSSEPLSTEVTTLSLSGNAEAQQPQQAREKARACMFKDVHFHIGG